MHFSTLFAALIPTGVAFAQTTHQITVGENGGLTFTPNQITGAVAGDTLLFTFVSGNHTVTRSSFSAPCTTDPEGPNSGFNTVSGGGTVTVNVPVTSSDPLWFYCRQTVPVDHCQKGMVFAMNPTADQPFSQFLAAAMGQNVPDSSTPAASTAAGATVAGSTATGGTGSSTSDATSPSGGASTPSSSTTSSAPSSTHSNAAFTMKAGPFGALLGGVGLLALAL